MVWEKGGVFGSVVVVEGEQDEWSVSRWKKRPGTGMHVWPNISVFCDDLHVSTFLPDVRSSEWVGQFHMVTQPHLRCLLGGFSDFFFFFLPSLMPRKAVQHSKDGPQVLEGHCLWKQPTAKGIWGSVWMPQNHHRDNSEIHSMWFLSSLQWHWTTVIHGGNQLNHASLHWCSLLPPPASSPPWEWSRQQTPCTQILVGEFQNQTIRLAEMRQYSRDIHPKWMKPHYSFFLVRKNYPSFSVCFFLAFPSLLFQKNGTVSHTFRLQLHGTRHGLS